MAEKGPISSVASDEGADAAKAARAKILEGVDFIETEEDAEAVESAVVKIQSTFRGKKFRSKLNKQTPPAAANNSEQQATTADSQSATAQKEPNRQVQADSAEEKDKEKDNAEEELKKGVATMQVNDNNTNDSKPANELLASLPEDEVERAATKIQAGFKGYKTRKELEGKLAGNSLANQQMEPQQQAADKPQ